MTLIFSLIAIAPGLIAKEPEKLSIMGKTITIKRDHGIIACKYVEDDKLQMTIGGTGGSVYRITIGNTHFNEPHAGSQISFLVVASSGSFIKYEAGMPVFEIWGRAGGGSYGRGLMRFIDGKYKSVGGELFTIHKGDSVANPIYMPGDTEKRMPLYPDKTGTNK